MKIVLFGATGMVGQGVLRECLNDPGVKSVLSVGRAPSGARNPRVHDLIQPDLTDYRAIESEATGYDACFFCLGTTSAGKSEAEYRRVTVDITLAAARTLSRLNPRMSFIYVSAIGADSKEKSRTMWARVRGETENALLALPFKTVCIFRPSLIQPMDGIQSRTGFYRLFYTITRPLMPLARSVLPSQISSTRIIGKAMLSVARDGAPGPILGTADFQKVAQRVTRDLR